MTRRAGHARLPKRPRSTSRDRQQKGAGGSGPPHRLPGAPAPAAANSPAHEVPQRERVPASGGRRERHKREIFERLVAAARSAMWNRDLHDLTIQDITEAADVGKGTFFNYFPTKEHVLPHVNDFARRVLKEVEESRRTGSEPVLKVLERIIRALLWPSTLDDSWITFWDNYVRVMVTNQDVRTLLSGQTATVRQAYTMLLTLGQERGEIRRDRPAEELAAQLHCVLFGRTVVEWIQRGTLKSDVIEGIISHTLSTLEPTDPFAIIPPAGSKRSAGAPPRRQAELAAFPEATADRRSVGEGRSARRQRS
jgi:AcrR family transcriptional regulator